MKIKKESKYKGMKKEDILKVSPKWKNCGFKKGNIPWNKGKRGLQKAWNKGLKGLRWQNTSAMMAYNKKNGVWNKGKKRPEISGKNHWNYGNNMSSNHINKFFNGHKKYVEENRSWNKGIPHTEEHKKKLKESRKYQILPVKNTSIEVKIQNFLKHIGVEFFTHQYMKIEHGYQCDILIPSMNLVIECDGNYWHKYPIGLEKDHIRTKELLEKGFKILRLWESEIILMDINEFKLKLGSIRKEKEEIINGRG